MKTARTKDETPANSLPFTSRFESIGVKVPDRRLSTQELMSGVRMWGKFDLEGLTGIRERRVCGENENSYSLSREAALDCLRYSSYRAEDLEMIICCSISKYKNGNTYVFEPPLSLYVKEAIGATRALNFDIANACAGMLTGVSIMNDFIRRGVIRCGMVISGENITSISRNAVPKVKTILSSQLASLTVGDCGAAVVLERSPEGKAALAVTDYVTLARYSDLCIGWACTDSPGAQMVTDARKIHQVAISDMPPIIEKALQATGLSFGDIDHIVPHQTSMRAIRSGDKRLAHYFGVRAKNIVVNLQEFGNTASTSHFLALYRFLKEKRFKQGERMMLIALASGLIIGVVIFTMDDLVDRYGSEN
ncbi:MAG: hypothetical protein KBG09_08380 [Syntrophobacterales bacterium]|nr:hypothetical protein [Syntrophobacterales bacterium]